MFDAHVPVVDQSAIDAIALQASQKVAQTAPLKTVGQGTSALKDLVVAVGLMLAIEGALYAAIPALMKRLMRDAMTQSDSIVRWVGFAALVAGVCLVWIIRG